MFWKKEEHKEVKEQVKCETCKHYIDKEDAQEIVRINVNFMCYNERNQYFCPIHKAPYDKTCTGDLFTSYYKKIPEHFIEVDEKGKEIKK